MIKAILFDCFGVLATDAWLPFKKQYFGNDPKLYRQASDLVSQANSGLIDYETFISSVADLAGVDSATVHRAITRNVPNDELFDYIRELKQDYKIGFLSNIAGDRLKQIFTADQLALLDVIELSYKTGFIKPQAEAYRNIAQQLGVAVDECVFVDDQERQVAGAHQIGMPAILYQDFEQFRTSLDRLLKTT